MAFFDVRVPDLPMTVVQADANDLEPVTVDGFRIDVAESYDVMCNRMRTPLTRSLRSGRIAAAMRAARWLQLWV
jgi:FtsP/CotA-like multicopper oxidase with cupredoxin domain